MKKTESEKEEQKKQNAVKFIIAAQQLLEEDNLNDISVRKIAQKAGFHNSTIYLYFSDLDELVMLASIKYFQEYSHMLELQSQKELSPSDNFISIWDFFFDAILKKPQLFYNFFFGKCSQDLDTILQMYYAYFPGERKHLSTDIEAMYFGKNISERSFRLLEPLIGQNTSVTESNIHVLNEIIVSYCKYKLEEKCRNPKLDSGTVKKDFLDAALYITGAGKPLL